MEEQHVAGFQLDRRLGRDERRVRRRVGQQELPGVEPVRAELDRVAARQHEKAAVLDALVTEREPGRNELRPLERPVADVAVPARRAAVPRVLRHDAVVVRLRKLDPGTEHGAQVRRQSGGGRPLLERGIARVCLQEPAHGAPARGVARSR